MVEYITDANGERIEYYALEMVWVSYESVTIDDKCYDVPVEHSQFFAANEYEKCHDIANRIKRRKTNLDVYFITENGKRHLFTMDLN